MSSQRVLRGSKRAAFVVDETCPTCGKQMESQNASMQVDTDAYVRGVECVRCGASVEVTYRLASMAYRPGSPGPYTED